MINGPLLTPAASIGYLIPKHLDKGRAESIYTDPFWFRTDEGKRLDEYDGGIIFVDEADKMDSDVKKVIGEAALSGRLGPHRLPNGWVVWMAGNRAADRSGSTKELDHLINRRVEIDITDDIVSFQDWCDENGVMPITKHFSEAYSHIVFEEKVPEKQGPWCTPRSLIGLDDYLQDVSGRRDDPEAPVPADANTVEEAQGQIGAGAASQYFAHLRLEREMPKYERIVAKPKDVKVPDKPDAMMLICYNLASRVKKEEIGPVIEYVSRMPKEFGVTFAHATCKRAPLLVVQPAFQAWAKDNASLMAAIAK